MKLSTSLLPISELKHNANKVVNKLRGTVIITQNGKAKAVLQDIETYEKIQEALALLKVVELGRRQAQKGQARDAEVAFDELDLKIRRFKEQISVKNDQI